MVLVHFVSHTKTSIGGDETLDENYIGKLGELDNSGANSS